MFDAHQLFLTLAQDGAAPPTEGAASSPGTPTGAPGATGSGTPAGAPGGFNNLFLILMVVVVFMLIMSTMSGRRERKRKEALLGAIKKHDRVQTIGGVIGSVVEIKPNTVVLKVDESSNTRITFVRSAIQQVLESGPETSSGGSTSDAARA